MELSIIVLTYNAKEITLKMFPALKKSVEFFEEKTGKKAEILKQRMELNTSSYTSMYT